MKIQRLYIFVLLMGCLPGLQAQVSSASIKVTGEVTKPLQLTASDLSKMTHVTAALKNHDGKEQSYSGVPLMDILQQAGVTSGKQLRGENLSKFMLVRCADGYEVLFSLAEVDTGFTDRVMIMADALEGRPLPANKGPFRLIVPGEKVPARSCFQVTEIVIRYGKE